MSTGLNNRLKGTSVTTQSSVHCVLHSERPPFIVHQRRSCATQVTLDVRHGIDSFATSRSRRGSGSREGRLKRFDRLYESWTRPEGKTVCFQSVRVRGDCSDERSWVITCLRISTSLTYVSRTQYVFRSGWTSQSSRWVHMAGPSG